MKVDIDEQMVSAVAMAVAQEKKTHSTAELLQKDSDQSALSLSALEKSPKPMKSPIPSSSTASAGAASSPLAVRNKESKRSAPTAVPVAEAHKPPPASMTTTVAAKSERPKRSRPAAEPAPLSDSSAVEKEKSRVASKPSLPKRQSAYRSNPADTPLQEDLPGVDKIDISAPTAPNGRKTNSINNTSLNLDSKLNEVNPTASEICEDLEATTLTPKDPSEETIPPQEQLTEEDLEAEFELKNFAALQSLRNMKLKKVNILSSLLAII